MPRAWKRQRSPTTPWCIFDKQKMQARSTKYCAPEIVKKALLFDNCLRSTAAHILSVKSGKMCI